MPKTDDANDRVTMGLLRQELQFLREFMDIKFQTLPCSERLDVQNDHEKRIRILEPLVQADHEKRLRFLERLSFVGHTIQAIGTVIAGYLGISR